jgi:hypothetical protein
MEAICSKYCATPDDTGAGSGTDKGTLHSYIPVYEKVLGPMRFSPVRMLEVGVMTGASLRMWDEYFTHEDKEIHGVDIRPDSLKYNVKNFHVLDATNPKAADILGGTWDIVIDDGSHIPYHQVKTLEIFGKRIRPDGYYIIEDINNMDVATHLAALGRDQGFAEMIYDLRENKGRSDDIMLVLKRVADA